MKIGVLVKFSFYRRLFFLRREEIYSIEIPEIFAYNSIEIPV
jgi:hypothetical protein